MVLMDGNVLLAMGRVDDLLERLGRFVHSCHSALYMSLRYDY